MTIYEQMKNRIDNLRRAGDACTQSGKTKMAIVWYAKAYALSNTCNDLTVEQAEAIV
jgi:hypothetical protein